MQERPIPSSGAMLPIVGLGTWKAFDVGRAPADRDRLTRVVETLLGAGGRMVDSSPMYGAAEEVVGDILGMTGRREEVFVATKVWTRGRAEGLASIERSMRLMRADPIDLVQVHNLVDTAVHLETLRALKAEGRVRHIGVTHYTPAAHAELEAVMRAEEIDTVQFDYSAEDRAAEDRLLPLAEERGIAVIVNVPLGAGALMKRVRGRPLPPVAAEVGAASWSELLLKFVLAHPAVTVAIPGTGNPEHMAANARAGEPPFPDARQRLEIIRAVEA